MNKRRAVLAAFVIIALAIGYLIAIGRHQKSTLEIVVQKSSYLINGSLVENLTSIDLSKEKWGDVPIVRLATDTDFSSVQDIIQHLAKNKWSNIRLFVGQSDVVINLPLSISESKISLLQNAESVSVTSSQVAGIYIKTGRNLPSEIDPPKVICYIIDPSTSIEAIVKSIRAGEMLYKYSYVYIGTHIFSDEEIDTGKWRGVAIVPKDILEKAEGGIVTSTPSKNTDSEKSDQPVKPQVDKKE